MIKTRKYKRILGKKKRLKLDVLYVPPTYIFGSNKLLNNNRILNVQVREQQRELFLIDSSYHFSMLFSFHLSDFFQPKRN